MDILGTKRNGANLHTNWRQNFSKRWMGPCLGYVRRNIPLYGRPFCRRARRSSFQPNSHTRTDRWWTVCIRNLRWLHETRTEHLDAQATCFEVFLYEHLIQCNIYVRAFKTVYESALQMGMDGLDIQHGHLFHINADGIQARPNGEHETRYYFAEGCRKIQILIPDQGGPPTPPPTGYYYKTSGKKHSTRNQRDAPVIRLVALHTFLSRRSRR